MKPARAAELAATPPWELEFDTERLQARRVNEQDRSLFLALYTDPEVMRFISKPFTAERAVRSFCKLVRDRDVVPPERVLLALRNVATRQPVGICGIVQFSPDGVQAEVGVMLRSEAAGKGYGQEAFRALVGAAFAAFGLDELWLECSSHNQIMKRVAAGIGFSPTRVRKIEPGPLLHGCWLLSFGRFIEVNPSTEIYSK